MKVNASGDCVIDNRITECDVNCTSCTESGNAAGDVECNLCASTHYLNASKTCSKKGSNFVGDVCPTGCSACHDNGVTGYENRNNCD